MPEQAAPNKKSDKESDKKRLATLSIEKDYFSFSAAHFTVFSKTSRERLHGHSFRARARVVAPVDANGLMFDYGPLKEHLKALCDELDERVLLPMHSPYLAVREIANVIYVHFNGEAIMTFPIQDVLVMPIKNVTIEEMSDYFLKRFLDFKYIKKQDISHLAIGISSGSGQWGESHWSLP